MKYLATNKEDTVTLAITEDEIRHKLNGTDEEIDGQIYLLQKGLTVETPYENYSAIIEEPKPPDSYGKFLKLFEEYGGNKAWSQEISHMKARIDCLVGGNGESIICHIMESGAWDIYSWDDAKVGEILERTKQQ